MKGVAMSSDRYDALCSVLEDWFERHKQLTRDRVKIDGVCTPPVARHTYLYDAGLFGRDRNGKAIWDAFGYVRDPNWPRGYSGSKAEQAFDARVRAGRFDLLREWVLVFDARSRPLYSDQDRANVLLAVANAAKRIADQRTGAS